MRSHPKHHRLLRALLLVAAASLFSFACNLPNLSGGGAATQVPLLSDLIDIPPTATPLPSPVAEPGATTPVAPVPVPAYTDYQQYDLLPYLVQPGDTLPALAARFRTSVEAILADNPAYPRLAQVSTLEPGAQVMIRLATPPAWDARSPVLPDALFVYGPAQADFDVQAYLLTTGGWLGSYVENDGQKTLSGAQIVEITARNYSISPRLLLALLEHRLGALTSPDRPASFFMGSWDPNRRALASQLSWAANALNNGYYGWRAGMQVEFSAYGGALMAPAPWQNAASVALQYYLSRFSGADETLAALAPGGLAQTYQAHFGVIDWGAVHADSLIPADLQQPALALPVQAGLRWVFTAGPHSGWGIGHPWAAIDFAPPSLVAGCDASPHWAVAAADGIIARSQEGVVVLDLDGDGNEHTGWVVLYLHIDPVGAVQQGTWVSRGAPIGHPSCVGGRSTGRNLHLARLYNGEWIAAGGSVPFNLDGWVVVQGASDYTGYLVRGDQRVYPSSLGDGSSTIVAD